MTRDNAKADAELKDTAGWLAVGAWVLVGVLGVRIAVDIGAAVSALAVAPEEWRALASGFGRGLIAAAPSILIVLSLVDFAQFFHRSEEGAAFSEDSLKMLKTGADSLFLASAFSIVISPTLLAWTGGAPGGFRFEVNDLALGAAAMGFAIHGVAVYFREAIRIKKENDEIV